MHSWKLDNPYCHRTQKTRCTKLLSKKKEKPNQQIPKPIYSQRRVVSKSLVSIWSHSGTFIHNFVSQQMKSRKSSWKIGCYLRIESLIPVPSGQSDSVAQIHDHRFPKSAAFILFLTSLKHFNFQNWRASPKTAFKSLYF